MMIRILALCLCLLPVGGLSQTYPALYDVTGVAADDVLNIRERPDPGAPIIGTLAHDAKGVEVIDLSDGARPWGLVNAGEGAGWVRITYLVAQAAGAYPATFPKPLYCVGTEPFWDAQIGSDDSFRFNSPQAAAWTLSDRSPVLVHGRNDKFSSSWNGAGRDVIALITREACSDGMSNRAFGFSGEFFVRTGASAAFYSGCCSLSAN